MARVLSENELKVFVKQVLDLELSYYRQNKLSNALFERVTNARENLEELNKVAKNDKPPKKELLVDSIFTTETFMALACGAAWGAIIGVGVYLVTHFMFNMSFSLKNLVILLAVVGAIIATVYIVITDRQSEKDVYKHLLHEYNEREQKRTHDIPYYKKSIAVCSELMELGNKEHSDTMKLLIEYYNLGYIYPKYQGLVPVSTIYEYLDSGRCSSLTGADGAYNLYESELRQNLIIEKLDDVLVKLDEIVYNQKLLSDAIAESSRLISSLCTSVEVMNNNTAVTACYSKVTAENTKYLSMLATYEVLSGH